MSTPDIRVRAQDEHGNDITVAWDIACLSGATMRRALIGLGLPVSGTNMAKAKRLAAAGLTRAEINDRFGWKVSR